MYEASLEDDRSVAAMKSQYDSYDDLSRLPIGEDTDKQNPPVETLNKDLGFIKSILNNGESTPSGTNHRYV